MNDYGGIVLHETTTPQKYGDVFTEAIYIFENFALIMPDPHWIKLVCSIPFEKKSSNESDR